MAAGCDDRQRPARDREVVGNSQPGWRDERWNRPRRSSATKSSTPASSSCTSGAWPSSSVSGSPDPWPTRPRVTSTGTRSRRWYGAVALRNSPSPWFLVLQHGGNNAAASNLIVGVAIVALGLFAVSGSRGFLGLEVGSLIAGVWLIISPFILNAHYTITPSMFWSNIFAG